MENVEIDFPKLIVRRTRRTWLVMLLFSVKLFTFMSTLNLIISSYLFFRFASRYLYVLVTHLKPHNVGKIVPSTTYLEKIN